MLQWVLDLGDLRKARRLPPLRQAQGDALMNRRLLKKSLPRREVDHCRPAGVNSSIHMKMIANGNIVRTGRGARVALLLNLSRREDLS